MSLATCSRRVTSLQALSRHYSSDKGSSSPLSSKVQSNKTLPPAKMRALIALYHQADSWITRDNLEQRIDQAFIPELGLSPRHALDVDVESGRERGWIRVDDLDKYHKLTRMAPKLAQWNRALASDIMSNSDTDWSLQPSKRELKVVEALYGMEAPNDNLLLPGLEILQETMGGPSDRKKGASNTQDLDWQNRRQNP
ncbi:hypothetical protein CPB84DRAFT_1846711 [Gymnopilus junonius]|uniref:Uncharacterized protein n=1 Tax=Gymnopilus junonius TaxID=109634 RepID=A0A9P5NRR2_GYMJU|nr:hypothetical protein CPB84DRAFT_1846711 [Gymnopilus junonius]